MGDGKTGLFEETPAEPYYDDEDIETDSSEEMILSRP